MSVHSELEQFVHAHQPGLWRYLRLIGCSRDEADDLAQETFIVVMRREFEDLGFEQSAAFLRRTARNLFLDSRRRTLRRREVDLDLAEQVFTNLASDGGDAYIDALRRCLADQPERTRQAIQAAYGDRLPASSIAVNLGMKPNGLKTLLQRARQALRECVQRRLP